MHSVAMEMRNYLILNRKCLSGSSQFVISQQKTKMPNVPLDNQSSSLYHVNMNEWFCSHCGQSTNHSSCGQCHQPSLLNERYALYERLGQGGSAETWKAFDREKQQWVAIKEMPWRILDGSKIQQRFFREAEFLRQMQHSAIPSYFDHFVTKNGRHSTLHIVQQFIEGLSLFEEMKTRRYSKDEVWEMAKELLKILQYIHGLAPAIIHRDIKPSNIIRDSQGHLVLIDFGSARDILTEVGLGASTVSGTFGYMSPEQIQGYATPQSDLYSVGAFMVHLLTRRDPSSLTDHQLRIHWEEHCSLSPPLSSFLNQLIESNSQKRLRSATLALSLLRDAIQRDRFPQPQNPPALTTVPKMSEEFQTQHQAPAFSTPPQQPSLKPQVPSLTPLLQELDPPDPSALDPLASLPKHRRGWWEPRPTTPPEQRNKATHPATQLVLMSSLMVLLAIGFQLLLIAIL